ncbi:MAG TPA: Fe2+-dependent dioxygenase [Burkholderiales bacterium]|nr:Fe2+-dependent dioxygenase [Burkholderiales bacterium]
MLIQIPNVLTKDEVEFALRELKQGAYEDGSVSAGEIAGQVKKNLQVKRDAEAIKKCAPMLLAALKRNSVFYAAALPLKIRDPLINRYDVGMTYGLHVDNALMGEPATIRSDVSATLFLSSPQDYDGGELVIQEISAQRRIKLPAGSMVLYASTNSHRVEPVTRGTRLAAIFWIQSMVRDEARRDILFDLNQILDSVDKKIDAAEKMALASIYHNLLRQWCET